MAIALLHTYAARFLIQMKHVISIDRSEKHPHVSGICVLRYQDGETPVPFHLSLHRFLAAAVLNLCRFAICHYDAAQYTVRRKLYSVATGATLRTGIQPGGCEMPLISRMSSGVAQSHVSPGGGQIHSATHVPDDAVDGRHPPPCGCDPADIRRLEIGEGRLLVAPERRLN